MRVWLVLVLVLAAGALALGANLALLGYAQPRNDPVGQLTPKRLLEIQISLKHGGSVADPALSPEPRPNERVVSGKRNDD